MFRCIRFINNKSYGLQNLRRSCRVEIPLRINKSSTDILYALAGSIGRDSTAPHYKYHDDPYLIPTTNVSKKIYAMSKESGRKAAKWIKEEHNTLFTHQEAEPLIAAFAPKWKTSNEVDVNDYLLEKLIMQAEVKDAIFTHCKIREEQLNIRPEVEQSFLELLCFYNNDEPTYNEWIEERWFKQNNEARERQGKTWKDGDLAEELFKIITPKTSETYCSIIRGFAKYRQADRAFSLFEEALEKHIEVDVATCNAMLRVVTHLKETAEQRWEFALNILKQMHMWHSKPNLDTINSLLDCISSFGNYKFARKCALQVLAECKLLHIEPSLGTYYYILIIFCRDRAPVSHVLMDILDKVSDKEISIRHPKDTFFFATAMDVCRNHLNDKRLAKKVDKLLHTGKNYNLIGDSYKEAVYYRHYLALLCQTETIDEFMQVYDVIVPNIYIPEPGIMEEILKAIEMNEAFLLMPRIWSDIIVFDHINRQSLLQRTINILVSMHEDICLPNNEWLSEKYANIGMDIFRHVTGNERGAKNLLFSGKMIGDILILLIKGKDFENASEVFHYILNHQHSISGSLSELPLMLYIDACVSNKSLTNALQCIEYASENQIDTTKLIEKILSSFNLNENQRARLKSVAA